MLSTIPWLCPILYKQVPAMSDESSPLADDAMVPASRRPARGAKRKKSCAPLVLALLALAGVLVVVIVAAGIAAYVIYKNLEPGRQADRPVIAAMPPPPGLGLKKPLEQAMWAFKAWYKAEPKGDVSSLMFCVALDETDETALRDKVLKNYPERTTGPLDWLPGLYRESLARGEKAKLDLTAVEKHIAATPVPSQRVACYFVGRILEQHGRKADAIRYYRRCVDSPQVVHLVFPTMAINRLRAMGVKDDKQP